MGMIILSTEESKKNTFEGNKSMFLGTLDEKAWREFLSQFNQETKSETTGLDEKARKELLSKMVKLREKRQKTRDNECEDSSTLKQKTDDKMIEGVRGDKVKASNMIKSTNILKARAGGGKTWKSRTGIKRSNQ